MSTTSRLCLKMKCRYTTILNVWVSVEGQTRAKGDLITPLCVVDASQDMKVNDVEKAGLEYYLLNIILEYY